MLLTRQEFVMGNHYQPKPKKNDPNQDQKQDQEDAKHSLKLENKKAVR